MTNCMTRVFNVRVCAVAAMIAAASLTGCASRKIVTSPTVHTVQVDGHYATQSTTVSKGQTLTVRLPTEAGTEAAWRYIVDPANSKFVDMIQMRSQQSSDGSLARHGETGFDVFTFRAHKDGEVTLKFMYDNPWNPDTSTASTMTLDVAIQDPRAMASASVSAESSTTE